MCHETASPPPAVTKARPVHPRQKRRTGLELSRAGFPPLQRFAIEFPADLIHVALHPLHDITPQAMDFLNLVEFLRAKAYDFPRFEVTVVQQVGQTPFAFAGEYTAYGIPQITTIVVVLYCWLPGETWLR